MYVPHFLLLLRIAVNPDDVFLSGTQLLATFYIFQHQAAGRLSSPRRCV